MGFSPEDSPPTGHDFIEQALSAPVSSEESMLRPISFQISGRQKHGPKSDGERRLDKKRSTILLSGPPGRKTTLSLLLGHEMGKKVSITSGPVIDKPADLAGLLTGLGEGDILFMTRFTASPKMWKNASTRRWKTRIDIMIDQGPNTRGVRLGLPKFTLVRYRMGLLTAPLRSRFTLQTRLSYYDHATLKGIVQRSCDLCRLLTMMTAP